MDKRNRAITQALLLALLAVGGHAGAQSGDAPLTALTVRHEDGVEIISSRSLAPAKPASTPVAASGGVVNATVSADTPDVARSAQSRLARRHAPMNATLSSGDPGALADDVRGDHRLRANLLNADGTANEQADNGAHRLVNGQREQAQADLKDALADFDAAKRNGASRAKLNALQARIRTNLDEIHILTHAQQSGVQ
ncbi:hypothetical protein C7401_111204 [Paraburkholderia unamae]|uniref:hypothetical protein n=1 Tax=Paraburkholderia unamae TaxID=219649 RepID=UPI000DC58F14|nr:hypothetical protein [Paraburkholderia unamae]RAR59354.1 hypothetical protein C7401_111204 [Paraburkholderia unamae]